MKNKKIIAWGTLLVMIIQLLPANILANPQNPLSNLPGKGITKVEVKHTVSGQIDIDPDVYVEWEAPPANDILTTHPDKKVKQEYYRFELTDILNNKAAVLSNQISKDAVNGIIQEYIDTPNAFVNGTLYKLRVIPYHTHEIIDGSGQTIRIDEIGPTAGTVQPEKYFITDLNTQVKDNEGKLEISWEYVPGATYQIVYAEGNKTQKEDFIDPAGGARPGTGIINMTDTEAKDNLVQNNGQKVRYVVPDSRPGEIYSAYVIVTDVQHAKVPKTSSIYINTATPKIAQATTSVVLNITNISKGKIRLDWNLGDWLSVDANLTLTRTTIYQKLKSQGGFTSVGIIHNNGVDPGYYVMAEPTEEAEYYVEFLAVDKNDATKNQTLKTKVVPYVPYELRVKPLPPQVPKPYNQKAATDDIKNYLVNGDDVDSASDRLIDNTFHVKSTNPLKVQFIWGAPKKIDSQEIDYELLYDIWVTEGEAQIKDSSLQPLEQNILLDSTISENLIYKKDKKTVVGFKWILNQYIKTDGTIGTLLPNKTYYMKIVAKRNYGNTIYEESDPTIVTITLDKDGDIFAPPVLGKPPLKLHEITKNTATLRWLETWAEIMPKNAAIYTDPLERFYAELWNSKVYTQRNNAPYMEAPYIRFKKLGSAANEEDIQILKTTADITRVKNIVDGNAGESYYEENFVDRIVTLGTDTRYEVKVTPYDEIALQLENETSQTTPSMIDIDSLGKWLIENESNSTIGWNTISPNSVTDEGLPAKEYLVPGLAANSRYVIMIRAYRILPDGTKLQQTFPSYILCTTLSDYDSPEPIPKVPILNFVTKNDTSITVKWIYNKSFDYEIVYSRLQNPDSATGWEYTASDDPRDENYVSDGAEAQVKITGLLPETTYNIWIRAKQKVGDKISAWSNPVTAKTDALGTPEMPTGLGPAAYQSILEAGQDFPPIGKDYLTVEWIKNPNDTEESGNDRLEKQYSYVVEFADNPEFLDSLVVNTTDGADGDTYEIIAKNMIRFNNLIANRPYYVKVKTILKFSDKEGSREIVKESEYTHWVRILTKKSSDEYDGGDNDNIVIYPNPIVEDYTKDVWTIEIVDTAKIISDIMKQNAYFFTIKAEKYNNRYDAEIRRIKIPKAVIDTLINRTMELRVITSTGTYELPVKALASYTKQYDAKDIVQFDFKRIIDYKIASIIKLYPETLLKGEQLDIVIRGKSITLPIKKLDGYLKVKLRLDAKTEYLYKNIFAYTYNFDRAAWTKETYSIDNLTDTSISYLTSVTGIYSIYEKKDIAPTRLSTYAMRQLASTYDMAALGTIYFQNDAVYRDQFVNLMLGVAQNKSQIDLTAPAYADSLTKAKSAGIYISSSSGPVNEEQAIAGIIKLYELKNGYKIKPSTVRLGGVSRDYQEAVSKAYALGLIEAINPTRPITYEVLCDWILQVTQ